MKKKILSVLFFYLWIVAFSQGQNIAINTTGATADPSAILDLSNTGSLGFLPPSVALTATNVAAPVVSPATGLLVYNTATAGIAPNQVEPGYYYWNSTAWIRIINQSRTTIPAFGFASASITNNTGYLLYCGTVASNATSLFALSAAWTPATSIAKFNLTTLGAGTYMAPASETLVDLKFSGWFWYWDVADLGTCEVYIVKYSVGTATPQNYNGTLGGTSLGTQTISVATAADMVSFNVSAGTVSLAAGDVICCVIKNTAGATLRPFVQGSLTFYINGKN